MKYAITLYWVVCTKQYAVSKCRPVPRIRNGNGNEGIEKMIDKDKWIVPTH